MNLDKISESMRGTMGRGTWLILAIICLLLLLIVVKLTWPGIAARLEARRRFRRLADANGLTSAERRLAHRLATVKFPENPLLIFVSPTSFDAAATALAVQNPDLRRKLYGA